MSRRGPWPRGVRGAVVAVVTVVAALAVLTTACSGDDASLRTFGAADAHHVALSLELHDGWIAGEGMGGPGDPPLFTIPAHTDLTMRIRNAGTTTHTLTLYASEATLDVLATTGEIEPGKEAMMEFHFHDAQTTLLRDDTQPETAVARLVAEMP